MKECCTYPQEGLSCSYLLLWCRSNGEKRKNAAPVPEGKNRRPLGDIGNVLEVKPHSKIARPSTSFAAQLLTDAQAAAVPNTEPVNVQGEVRKACIKEDTVKAVVSTKPLLSIREDKRKVVVNPIPTAVIEYSPDTVEKVSDRLGSKKRRKKKGKTMSQMLSVCSKAACENVGDLYKFYKLAENEFIPHNYMDTQVEINEKMRAVLGDWLIEVHFGFKLMPETLYLSFYIIDKYLSMETVRRKDLQLVGITSILIASKYEEMLTPRVEDFVSVTDHAYNEKQVLNMEKMILSKLEWTLTVPTPYVFLVRFIKAAIPDKQLEHMVYFFAELGLLQYKMIMNNCPSKFAASAVYAARCTLNRTPLWTETLRRRTGFSESELKDSAKMLVNFHIPAQEGKLIAIYQKYSRRELGAVACIHLQQKLLYV